MDNLGTEVGHKMRVRICFAKLLFFLAFATEF